jgi:hypothetical protein
MQTIPVGTRVVVLPEFRMVFENSAYDGDELWTGHIERYVKWKDRYLVRYTNQTYDWYYADELRVLES